MTESNEAFDKMNLFCMKVWKSTKKVNRKVQEEPQAEVASNPWHPRVKLCENIH